MNERPATVFQTRAAAIGKARSSTVGRFDVGTANQWVKTWVSTQKFLLSDARV